MYRFSSRKFLLLALILASPTIETIQDVAGRPTQESGNEQETDGGEFMGASAEIQSVNSYLTEAGQMPGDSPDVLQHLKEAQSILNAIGDDVIRTGVESDAAEPLVRCLLGNNPDSLKQILSSLISSSESCDRESIEFLSLVESQTFDGQILHSYSKARASLCQNKQAEIVTDRLEKSLDKIGSELYDLMADLASAYVMRDRKSAASRGTIVISDGARSADPNELLRALREIQLEADDKQQLFATMVRNYYAREFRTKEGEQVRPEVRKERLRIFFIGSLMDPCQELSKRWKDTLSDLASFGVCRSKVAEAMERRRNSSSSFARSIEMVRICRRIGEKWSSLLASVER